MFDLGMKEKQWEIWECTKCVLHSTKRKKGTWIIEGVIELNSFGKIFEPVYKCSCCGRATESYVRFDKPEMPEDADFPRYCQWCGAKMEVTE